MRELIKKLEKIKLLERLKDSSITNSRDPQLNFVLKLQSKDFASNMRYLEASIARYCASTLQKTDSDINAKVRQARALLCGLTQQQHGKIRIFGIPEPVEVNRIYTATDVWQEIISQRWRTLFDLPRRTSVENLDRLGITGHDPPRQSGWDLAENFERLMVLGKPGIGKTTYLKYLAVQCVEGRFQPDKVPFLVQLSQFGQVAQADLNQAKLVSYLTSTLIRWRMTEQEIRLILREGKALILLDGLDEVPAAQTDLVIEQIRQFINLYSGNSFIITCRVASNKYRFANENFTEVEVSDFNREQSKTFIQLWFRALQGDISEASNLSEELIDAFNQPNYRAIRELTVTPLLLNLVCLVFRDLKFLPKTRHQLYEAGIKLLLEEWDRHRNIQRDEIYRNLGKASKIDLLVDLARTTFEQSQYLFERHFAQTRISQFLQQSGLTSASSTQLEVDSQNIIEAIAAHHGLLVERAVGIFSFSHLTFQEYFTARSIYQGREWQALLPEICNPQWREVFLLVVEMLTPADELVCLMREKIYSLFAPKTALQALLNWTNYLAEESASTLPYQPSALRAWFISQANLNLDEGIFSFRKSGQAETFDSALLLAQTMGLDPQLVKDLSDFNTAYSNLWQALGLIKEESVRSKLLSLLGYFYDRKMILKLLPKILLIKEFLLQLEDVSNPQQQKQFINWWQKEGVAWASSFIEELDSLKNNKRTNNESLMEQLRKLDKQDLQDYYISNLLLLDCLRRAKITPDLRENIELNLLRPASELQLDS